MWRGDPSAPERPASHATRVVPLMAALRAEGVEPEPVVYFDDEVEEARRRLAQVDGVMVWINPLADGRDRARVDTLLREIADQGAWVSAHPATILTMGTKEVLFRTRHLGWGADTELQLVAGPRVLKPLRGNDGQGVLKVEAVADGCLVQQAPMPRRGRVGDPGQRQPPDLSADPLDEAGSSGQRSYPSIQP